MAESRATAGTFDVWRRLAAARVRSDWQYRSSFVLFLTSQALVEALELAVIAAIFSQVDRLAGWTGSEVGLLYGMSSVAFALADSIVSPVETASMHIKAGTFDLFLRRPAPALVQLCATEFAPRRLGKLFQGGVVLAGALFVAPVDWRIETVLLLPVAIVSGMVIFGALFVATTSIVFWTIDGQETANAFTYGGRTAAQYPLDIVSGALRRLVTFVVPLAFVGYLPAARMLGRDRAVGLPSTAAWAAPLVAAAAALAARVVWGIAIRHYRSTGS